MTKRRMHDGYMWENPKFAKLTMPQRLLFCALIDTADDQGRMIGEPGFVKSKTLPYDDLDEDTMETMLAALAENQSILLYQNSDIRYLQIVNWWEYQSPQWASPSRLPAPEGWRDRIRHRLDPKTIITCNWITPAGNILPDTCDTSGRPLGMLDSPLPSPLGNDQGNLHGYGNGYGEDYVDDDALQAQAATAAAYTAWQNARGGAVNYMDAQQIGDFVDEYTAEWVTEAIQEANRARSDRLPSLNFVRSILDRWGSKRHSTPKLSVPNCKPKPTNRKPRKS